MSFTQFSGLFLLYLFLAMPAISSGAAHRQHTQTIVTHRGCIVGQNGSILLTHDGGFHWATHKEGHSPLTAARFFDDSIVFITGLHSTALLSTDGGTKWEHKSPHAVRDFSDVVWFDRTTAVIVGRRVTHTDHGQKTISVILRTTDLGKTWMPSTGIEDVHLNGITSGLHLRSVAVGDSGHILATSDGGVTWNPQSSGTRHRLNGIARLDSAVFVAVGSNGTILRSSDTGVTWSEQVSTATADLHQVAFSSNGTGIAVGAHGTVLQSRDGGKRWVMKSSGTAANLHAVDFADNTTVIAIGAHGTIIRSKDSGDRWHVLERSTTEDLTGITLARH